MQNQSVALLHPNLFANNLSPINAQDMPTSPLSWMCCCCAPPEQEIGTVEFPSIDDVTNTKMIEQKFNTSHYTVENCIQMINDLKPLIEVIKGILENARHMPPAFVPHFTVLACLSGLALWGAMKNDGLGMLIIPLVATLLATLVGATSGLWSFCAGRSNWNFNKTTTLDKLDAIVRELNTIENELDSLKGQKHEDNCPARIVLNTRLNSIDALLKRCAKDITSLKLNCSQSHNTCFASATGGITTFAYTSLHTATFVLLIGAVMLALGPIGFILAAIAAIVSIKLGNHGQLNSMLMNKIKSTTDSVHLLLCGGTVAKGLSPTRGMGLFDSDRNQPEHTVVDLDGLRSAAPATTFTETDGLLAQTSAVNGAMSYFQPPPSLAQAAAERGASRKQPADEATHSPSLVLGSSSSSD